MHRFCPTCQAKTPWIPGSRWFCDGCGMNDDDHDAPTERRVICDCKRFCATLPGVLLRCPRCNALINDGSGVDTVPPAPKTSACIPAGVQLYQIDGDGEWNPTYHRTPSEFEVVQVKDGFVWLDDDGLAALLHDYRREWEHDYVAPVTRMERQAGAAS